MSDQRNRIERVSTDLSHLSDNYDPTQVQEALQYWVDNSVDEQNRANRILCLEFLAEVLTHHVPNEQARHSISILIVNIVRNYRQLIRMRDEVNGESTEEGGIQSHVPGTRFATSFVYSRINDIQRLYREMLHEVTNRAENVPEEGIEESSTPDVQSSDAKTPSSSVMTNEERKQRILSIQRDTSLSPSDKAREMQALFSPATSSSPESGRLSIRKQVHSRKSSMDSEMTSPEASEPFADREVGAPQQQMLSSLATHSAEGEAASFIDGVSQSDLHQILLHDGLVLENSEEFMKQYEKDISEHFPPICSIHAQIYDVLSVEHDGVEVDFANLDELLEEASTTKEREDVEFVREMIAPGRRFTFYKKLMPVKASDESSENSSGTSSPVSNGGITSQGQRFTIPREREQWKIYKEELGPLKRFLKIKTDMTHRNKHNEIDQMDILALTPASIEEWKHKAEELAQSKEILGFNASTGQIQDILTRGFEVNQIRDMNRVDITDHLRDVIGAVTGDFLRVYDEMETRRSERDPDASNNLLNLMDIIARERNEGGGSVSTTPVIEQVLADAYIESSQNAHSEEEEEEEEQEAEEIAEEDPRGDIVIEVNSEEAERLLEEQEQEGGSESGNEDEESEEDGWGGRMRLESDNESYMAEDKDQEEIEEKDTQETPADKTIQKGSFNVIFRFRNVVTLRYGCRHYVRNCAMVCPDCNEVYTCRLCHDEDVYDHKFDRSRVTSVVCLACSSEVPFGQSCNVCGQEFGHYCCNVCHFIDDFPDKKIYHCDKCGICRVGDKDLYFHCDKCGGDWDKRVPHQCIADSLKEGNCPICREPLFATRKRIVALPCRHPIHADCLIEMHKQSSKPTCPICSKLALTGEYKEKWESWMHQQMNYYISAQRNMTNMPNELNRTVRVLCHECGAHFTATDNFCGIFQCPKCHTHNTTKL